MPERTTEQSKKHDEFTRKRQKRSSRFRSYGQINIIEQRTGAAQSPEDPDKKTNPIEECVNGFTVRFLDTVDKCFNDGHEIIKLKVGEEEKEYNVHKYATEAKRGLEIIYVFETAIDEQGVRRIDLVSPKEKCLPAICVQGVSMYRHSSPLLCIIPFIPEDTAEKYGINKDYLCQEIADKLGISLDEKSIEMMIVAQNSPDGIAPSYMNGTNYITHDSRAAGIESECDSPSVTLAVYRGGHFALDPRSILLPRETRAFSNNEKGGLSFVTDFLDFTHTDHPSIEKCSTQNNNLEPAQHVSGKDEYIITHLEGLENETKAVYGRLLELDSGIGFDGLCDPGNSVMFLTMKDELYGNYFKSYSYSTKSLKTIADIFTECFKRHSNVENAAQRKKLIFSDLIKDLTDYKDGKRTNTEKLKHFEVHNIDYLIRHLKRANARGSLGNTADLQEITNKQKVLQELIRKIKSTFANFKQESQLALEEFRKGEINEHECHDRLSSAYRKIPPVEEFRNQFIEATTFSLGEYWDNLLLNGALKKLSDLMPDARHIEDVFAQNLRDLDTHYHNGEGCNSYILAEQNQRNTTTVAFDLTDRDTKKLECYEFQRNATPLVTLPNNKFLSDVHLSNDNNAQTVKITYIDQQNRYRILKLGYANATSGYEGEPSLQYITIAEDKAGNLLILDTKNSSISVGKPREEEGIIKIKKNFPTFPISRNKSIKIFPTKHYSPPPTQNQSMIGNGSTPIIGSSKTSSLSLGYLALLVIPIGLIAYCIFNVLRARFRKHLNLTANYKTAGDATEPLYQESLELNGGERSASEGLEQPKDPESSPSTEVSSTLGSKLPEGHNFKDPLYDIPRAAIENDKKEVRPVLLL